MVSGAHRSRSNGPLRQHSSSKERRLAQKSAKCALIAALETRAGILRGSNTRNQSGEKRSTYARPPFLSFPFPFGLRRRDKSEDTRRAVGARSRRIPLFVFQPATPPPLFAGRPRNKIASTIEYISHFDSERGVPRGETYFGVGERVPIKRLLGDMMSRKSGFCASGCGGKEFEMWSAKS